MEGERMKGHMKGDRKGMGNEVGHERGDTLETYWEGPKPCCWRVMFGAWGRSGW